MRNYADTIAFLGQWGRFQQVVFFLLCASIIPNGFGAFMLVFLTDIPAHHCFVPDANLTEDWIRSSIPVQVVDGKQERSRCTRYRLDLVRNLSARGLAPGRDLNLTDLEQESCLDGWVYSRDTYQSTIVTEFDLVCSDQWKQPLTSTVFFIGVLCGSFFSGQLSDRFGRKPVLFATMALQTIFTFVQAFSTSWIVFTVLLFFNGLGQISNFVAALVLGAEILTFNVRVMYSSMGTCMGFAVGYLMLPLFAYFIRDWKTLLLALSAPGLAYIPLWWLIPESPRWLLSQGRVDEAEAIVRKAARWNKVQAPEIVFEEYLIEKTKPQKNPSVFGLLKTNNLRITTVTLCLVALTFTVSYYGLSFNTAQLHTDPYISCFISAFVEIPAYIASWLSLRFLSRRLSVIGSLLGGALPLYFIQLVPESLPSVALALEMLGKFFFTNGLSLMFAYTAELYPTVLRNTATGTCMTVSRLGSCIAPFLLKLNIYYRSLHYITLATLAVLSALSGLVLPESFGQPLPESIEQMHQIGSIKCPCNNRKETPKPVSLLPAPV